MSALYVHIPFCDHICAYCDFAKVFYKSDWVNRYLSALEHEMSEHPMTLFETVFIGGGTPSSLSLVQLERLLKMLEPYTSKVIEYTVELNPESTTKEKLDMLKSYGVNRLSFGVQTTNDSILKVIGRQHRLSDVEQVLELAKEIGFENISFDFMYGLPNQTLEDIHKDLEWIKKQSIQHISYYELILEDNTKLKIDGFKPLDSEMGIRIDELIESTFKLIGLDRYEVSNYALPHFKSKHNMVYWDFKPYVGIGLNASSFYQNTRRQNTKSLTQYLERNFEPSLIALSEDEQRYEYLMVGLRKVSGIVLKDYNDYFHSNVLDDFPVLKEYLDKGLLIQSDTNLFASKEGYLVLNDILVDCLD